jgi:hypothetical protein
MLEGIKHGHFYRGNKFLKKDYGEHFFHKKRIVNAPGTVTNLSKSHSHSKKYYLHCFKLVVLLSHTCILQNRHRQ